MASLRIFVWCLLKSTLFTERSNYFRARINGLSVTSRRSARSSMSLTFLVFTKGDSNEATTKNIYVDALGCLKQWVKLITIQFPSFTKQRRRERNYQLDAVHVARTSKVSNTFFFQSKLYVREYITLIMTCHTCECNLFNGYN